MNILHISNTPLVGSPAKIVDSLLKSGHTANLVCAEDYPNNGPLFQKFTESAFVLTAKGFNYENKFIELLKKAEIIHIHNDISKELVKTILTYGSNAKFVYQVHSPLKEGPLYLDRSDLLGLSFDAKLVVAQYHPRHYQDFIPVPNIVNTIPSVSLRKDDEPLKVMFSPTHSRAGRWNSKTNDKVNKAFEMLKSIKDVELVYPENPVHPSLLLNMRRQCHVSVDEVITGAFHQVSLEGLMAGNVVLNNADFFSKMAFADSTGSQIDENPFSTVNDDELFDLIYSLSKDVNLTRLLQEKSYNFAKNYMDPLNLIKEYENVYKSL